MAVGVSGLGPLLSIVPWMRVLRRWETSETSAAATAVSNRFSFAASFGLLRHPTVLGTFLGFFAFDYVWFVFAYWLPGYLRLERHFSPTQMAFHSTVPFLVMSVVIVLSCLATDRLIAAGFREVPVRKTFIAVGFAIPLPIVPAVLFPNNATPMWLFSTPPLGPPLPP